jgi:hypothetical protein
MDEDKIITAVDEVVRFMIAIDLTFKEAGVVAHAAARMINLIDATPHAKEMTLEAEAKKIVLEEMDKVSRNAER